MSLGQHGLERLQSRILSKAAFFTSDRQAMKDLAVVIESLRHNISPDFYLAGDLSEDEIEVVFLDYIKSKLLVHVGEQWDKFPVWQKILFQLSYRRVIRRMEKVRFLVSAISAVDQTKAKLTASY